MSSARAEIEPRAASADLAAGGMRVATGQSPVGAAAIARLRTALRGTDARALDEAAGPIMDRMYRPLLRYCDALLRGAPAVRRSMEGEDLALEAWHKSLRHLRGERGDRIVDDQHFERLLRVAARSILLDALDRPATTLHGSTVEIDERDADERSASGVRPPDPLGRPEALLFLGDHRHLQLVELLFTQESRFRTEFRQTNQRHPRHYRAMVLYELGAFLRSEAVGGRSDEGTDYMIRLMRRYVSLLGVPPDEWRRIETAALAPLSEAEEAENDLIPPLRDAVNAVCGTRINGRAFLSVLRYEMNRFAYGSGQSSGGGSNGGIGAGGRGKPGARGSGPAEA
jgi:hypothetical protein